MRIDGLIRAALKEDIGTGDITTKILFPDPAKITARIIAKEGGVVCGVLIAVKVFKLLGKKNQVILKVKDGSKIKKGGTICVIKGNAGAILTGERVALNFLGRLSGIATLTRKYVEKIKPCKTKILDTRKTTPLLRELEKYAVKCGGGTNHRMGLWDMALVKDNHIAVHGPRFTVHGNEKLGKIVEKIRKKTSKRIEIEVESLKQFKEALQARPDVIMLDNMRIQDIKRAISMCKDVGVGARHAVPLLEVSGGVTLDNIKAIARTGVDMISVGALTHSARAMDFSLEVSG